MKLTVRLLLATGALLALACRSPSGPPVRVIVPKGASFAAAADSLERHGLVRSPFFFRVYGRLTRADRNIKPGTYLLQHGTPWSGIVEAMHGGKGLVNSVTIPEGFSLLQIVPLLSQRLNLPLDSVAAAVRDTALLAQLEIPVATLEGYLFPDTYAFPDGTGARDAVLELVRRFEREWKPEWNAQLVQLGRSRHEIVTLASIIEREARIAAERPVISAVYHNRLKAGMLLQADPTVLYAHGRHSARVFYRDLEIDSPYNTYRYSGLPPGPIASPGGPSLVAALFPASVSFRYFVAFPDGHHEFRNTLAEHEVAKRAAQRDSSGAGR